MSFIKKSKYRISLLLVLALVVQLAGPILANYAYADDDLGSQAEQETPSEEEINEDEDEDLPSPEEEEGEEDPEGDGETEDDLDNPDDEGDSDTPPEDEDQKKEEIEEEVQIDDPKVDIPQEEPMIGPKAQGDITIFSGGEVFQFITNVSITDLDGNELGEGVDKNSGVEIKLEFKIPDAKDFIAKKEYTLDFPSEIKIKNKITIPLTIIDEDTDKEELMATVDIDTDNVVRIVFTEYATTQSGIEGDFEVRAEFDELVIGEGGDTNIKFDLGAGVSKEIKVNFRREPETTNIELLKSGDFDENENEITWTIRVKPETTPNVRPMNDVVITDIIQVGQTYKEFVGIKPADGTPEPVGEFSHDEDTNTLTYTFTEHINTVENEEYIITFTTTPNEEIFKGKQNGEKIYFTNKAEATFGDHGPFVSNEVKLEYITLDYVRKDGEYIKDTSGNRENDRIKWTVTVNKNNFNIEDAKIEDTIPKWLELDVESVKLDTVKVDKEKFTITGDYKEGKTTLTYELGAITKKHVLTYETIIKDPNHYKGNSTITYTNNVKFTGDGGIEGTHGKGVGVGKNKGLIKKSGSQYDASTHEFTWTITVNENEIKIEDAIVTDTIPERLEFVAGSIKIGDTLQDDDNYDSSSRTITLNLGTISDKKVITFKTKVIDPKIWAKNDNTSKFKNYAKLNGKNIGESNDDATVTVKSNVITKTGAGYDYQTRIATWKIVVNNNDMEMTNAVITDKIGDDQEFLGLEHVTINPNIANASSFNEGVLTVTLGDISEKHIITFKTKIKDPDSFFKTNGDKVLSNTATLTLDELPDGYSQSSTGTNPIGNTVVSKSGLYENGDDFIDWEVIVNQNKLVINDATLADELQEGLLLDTSSIKLYKLEVKSDGTYEKIDGEVTEGLDLDFDYDPETRMFELRLGNIKDAYMLEFTTDVDDEFSDKTFVNKINFKGSDIDQDGTSESILVEYQTGSGSITGKTGSITVIKVDENDNDITLRGAIFEIYDKFGRLFRVSEPTEGDGIAIFNKLKFSNEYTIKEQVAPEGYNRSIEEYTFELKNVDDQRNITYKFKNNIIKGNIQFTKKTDDDDIKSTNEHILPGVEFELYKESDTNFENPIGTSTSDSDGIVIFEDVPYGKYVIKETDTPEGYLAYSGQLEVEIKEEGKTEVLEDIVNKKVRGNIEILKIDRGTETPLKGATIGIYDSTDRLVEEKTTDETGKVTFDDLAYGDYYFREIQAPAGYIRNNDKHDFKIEDHGNTISHTLENRRRPVDPPNLDGRIRIVKKDYGSKELLTGAEFNILDSKGNIVDTLVTASNGEAVSKYLPLGSYTVKEIKAPSGYILDRNSFEVKVSDGIVKELLVYNDFDDPDDSDDPDPKDPKDPTKPKDPEEPKDPEKPVKPVDPEDPEKPTDPEDPEEEDIENGSPEGTTEADPKEPGEDENVDGDSPAGLPQADPDKPKGPTLPKTGSASMSLLYMIGMVSLGIGFALMRKNKKE